MKKIIILTLVLLISSISFAETNDRNFTISNTLVTTNLTVRRKIRDDVNIKFVFRADVDHLSTDATCVHFLELIATNLKDRDLPEVTAKRVSTTTQDSLVRWVATLRSTRRTVNRKSKIHARVSSTCTQGTTAQIETSNVASRYTCTDELAGVSPRRQQRQLRKRLRVRTRVR